MGNPWGTSAEDLEKNGYGTRIFSREKSRWQPSEGPELVKHNDYYWLFFANDGLDVPYQTRVVRAKQIQGPYTDIRERDFTTTIPDTFPLPIVTHPYKFNDNDNGLGSCYGWVGISHCAIFQDEDSGEWYYMSQQRLPENVAGNPYSNAIMMGGVRKLVWTPSAAGGTDLWPIALPERYGGIPEDYAGPVTEDEIPGTWQHIDLVYDSGKMDTAKTLTLNADKTMSGAFTGTWTFDSNGQQLTLRPASGNAFTVTVTREIDWEKNPRVPTIVYAGVYADTTTTSNNRTYWGKKETEAAAATSLLASYSLTIADKAKNDLQWYLYPQEGSWSIAIDNAAATTVAAKSKTRYCSLADGNTLTFTASTTDSAGTFWIEGYSTNANAFVDVDPFYMNVWDWEAGTGIAGRGNSDTRRPLSTGAQTVTVKISRTGAEHVIKIYKN